MVFSFYYTDKIALMVQSNNPIMKQINQEKEKHEEESVNAIINEDKIIPGKNGLTINVEKSFSAMKSFNAFNSNHEAAYWNNCRNQSRNEYVRGKSRICARRCGGRRHARHAGAPLRFPFLY